MTMKQAARERHRERERERERERAVFPTLQLSDEQQ